MIFLIILNFFKVESSWELDNIVNYYIILSVFKDGIFKMGWY